MPNDWSDSCECSACRQARSIYAGTINVTPTGSQTVIITDDLNGEPGRGTPGPTDTEAIPRDARGRFISRNQNTSRTIEGQLDWASEPWTVYQMSATVWFDSGCQPPAYLAEIKLDGELLPFRMVLEDERIMRYVENYPTRSLASWIQSRISTCSFGRVPQTPAYNLYGDSLPVEFTGRMSQAFAELWYEQHPRCEICERFHGEEQDHFECASCGDDRATSDMVVIEWTMWRGTDSATICADCEDDQEYLDNLNLFHCNNCAELGHADLIFSGPDTGYAYCEGCYDEMFTYCDECESTVSQDEFNYDEGMCDSCCESGGVYGLVHEWDYRPELVFHPEPWVGKPLYIGMELELSWPGHNRTEVKAWLGDLPEDLLYAKHDSSVSNGFEVVTHPMQPKWALANFPFELFEKAIALGAKETHTSTGTHIHMNKEAFSPQHLWKFMQLHFRMPDFCGTVGGRGVNASYGSLIHDSISAQRAALKEIVQKKGPIHDYDRYVALNLRNEYTIEMRYMRGGILPAEIKKNIEWAQALYEYTDYVKVSDVRDGAFDDPGYFLDWINNGRYPNLARWLAPKFPVPKKLKARAL